MPAKIPVGRGPGRSARNPAARRSSLTATQLLLERLPDQRSLVDISERVGERLCGDVVGDAERLKLTLDPEPTAAFDLERGRDVSRGHAGVVQCSAFEQARNRVLDVVGLVLAIQKAGPNLRDGQFAPCEQMETVGVGGPTIQT